MSKSLLDLAFDYVSEQKQQSKFQDIWAYCVKEAGLSEEEAAAKVSRFYTNLMLDGRFVTLGENEWDLRIRHKFEKVHIDMSEVYSDVETFDDDSEEPQESPLRSQMPVYPANDKHPESHVALLKSAAPS